MSTRTHKKAQRKTNRHRKLRLIRIAYLISKNVKDGTKKGFRDQYENKEKHWPMNGSIVFEWNGEFFRVKQVEEALKN